VEIITALIEKFGRVDDGFDIGNLADEKWDVRLNLFYRVSGIIAKK
jgi:hypothetical protein